MLIGTIGTIAGVFTGLILSELSQRSQKTFYRSVPPSSQLTPTIALMGLVQVHSGLPGSLYPAASASRINIIQAIRPSARNSRNRVRTQYRPRQPGMLTLGSLEAARLTPFHVSYLDVALIPIGLVILGAVIFDDPAEY